MFTKQSFPKFIIIILSLSLLLFFMIFGLYSLNKQMHHEIIPYQEKSLSCSVTNVSSEQKKQEITSDQEEFSSCPIAEVPSEQEETSICTHSFSDWISVLPATKNKQGQKAQICSICYEINIDYTDKISPRFNNCLVIPALNINDVLFIGDLNQKNIDKHPIVCNEDYIAYKKDGSPTTCTILAGHNYWTLGCLYELKLNDYIYLYLNGNETIYKVVLSDEAIVSADRYDLISIQTGETLNNYRSNKKLLKIYTCFNNNRWLIIAEKTNISD